MQSADLVVFALNVLYFPPFTYQQHECNIVVDGENNFFRHNVNSLQGKNLLTVKPEDIYGCRMSSTAPDQSTTDWKRVSSSVADAVRAEVQNAMKPSTSPAANSNQDLDDDETHWLTLMVCLLFSISFYTQVMRFRAFAGRKFDDIFHVP